MLSLKGVVAGYGGGNVLQGVDLNVAKGSITCIVGPNGAGKSTVLRTISGLLSPSAGTIDLLGKPIHKLNCHSILSQGVVQLPQHDALFPLMTVRENVMMGGYLIRRQRALIAERYEYVESLIPLVRDRPHDKAGNLSGGQRRMVELGRTLMLDPSLILMDEPSLGLDPKAVVQVWDLIRLFVEQQRTILLVEQNVKLGFKVATHGVIMEGGKVRREGEPSALLADPDMTALYLGGTTQEAAPTSDKESVDGRPDS